MKFINNNGAIFGINIFDLFIIIVIIALIPAAYYAYKVCNARPEQCPIILEIQQYHDLQEKVNEFISEHKKMRKYFE